MRSLLLIILSFAVTILAWGIYGPVLHWGQHEMSTIGKFARMRPFVCVGMAYFVIGVVVPAIVLMLKGESGQWTMKGIVYSLAGGALGAVGALGIIMAFTFGGKPGFVMPLVFGGAPVVNSFLTIYMAKRLKDIGPIFLAGLVMVVLGAVTVLINQPSADSAKTQAEVVEAQVDSSGAEAEIKSKPVRNFLLQILSIATIVVCWGAYGPVLHKGQAAMDHSRLRPLLCVGLAYFAIAVLVPNFWLITIADEPSEYTFKGTVWSLAAGSAGAIGALGIIMAFNFGGKPVYVMPLVFGGAPVVNTVFTITANGLWGSIHPLFYSGLMLLIAGAAMVLVFAPKGPPPAKVESPEPTEPQKEDTLGGDAEAR